MRRTVLRAFVVTYAALIVAPLPAVLLDPTLPALVGGALVGAVLGGVVTDWQDAAALVSTLKQAVVGFVVPFVWIPVGVDSGTAAFWMLGLLAALAWLAAAVAAIAVRQHETRQRVTTVVSFEARPPEKNRRQTKVALRAFAVLGVGFAAVLFYVSGDVEPTTWMTLMPVWLVFLSTNQEQAVDITDEGLLVQGALYRWERIDGYELTDEKLVIDRTEWYHGKQQYDPADIEDLDAVTKALDRFC